MTAEKGPPAPGSTKGRILRAAVRRFAATSYHDTHLRDIAADAAVDVAHAHRSFGSKERLFLAVLEHMSRDHGITRMTPAEFSDRLTRSLFSDHLPVETDDPEPLLVLIRSLTVPLAAGPIGEKLNEMFIRPIQQKLGNEDGLRAASIMSMLIGLRIMRNFLKLPDLRGIDGADAARQTDDLLRAIIAQVPDRPAAPPNGPVPHFVKPEDPGE
ncbi:TetR family transcriptional regulator [Pseudogemmobacter sonorensis]|uniref:TetR/AcrR family transcriptional regulator n=1 Tax=Pseudogemmobacter sonorensis TaxID=2989681 RepID=UPI0036B0E8B8